MNYGCELTFLNTGDDAEFGNRLGWLDCGWLRERREVGMNGGMARAGGRMIFASAVMIVGMLSAMPATMPGTGARARAEGRAADAGNETCCAAGCDAARADRADRAENRSC